MHKLFLVLFVVFGFNATSLASSSPTFKLRGGYEFQTIFYRNNNIEANKYVSANRKTVGFNSSGHVDIEVKNVVENFLEYGAKVSLATAFHNDRKVSASLYVLSDDYGKLELGSDKSVYSKMKVTGYSGACGTAGGWDSFVKLSRVPSDDKVQLFSYATNYGNFLDAKTRSPGKVEYSRKISYFTPKFYNLQIGVSYIPDTSNTGNGSLSDPEYHALAKPSPYKFAVVDGIAYGVTHESSLSEDLKIKTSVVGERGRIKTVSVGSGTIGDKFKNLSTYTIGSKVSYKQFSVAASYSDYMKSLTSPSIDKISRDTKIYSVGAHYKYNEKLASSVNYFYSNYKKSTVNATTLAIDYIIARGFLSYAEITHYSANGKCFDLGSTSIKTEKTKGQIFITGIKLEF